jgi:hypothetical protein
MINNLYVIGYSFCRDSFYVKPKHKEEKSFWALDLSKKLNVKLLCDGEPSRDLQTILDNWIKIIKDIKKEDYLVICVPFFKRTRLPLSKNYYRITELNYVNRFVGTASYNNLDVELEFYGNSYNWKELEEMLTTQEVINSTASSQLNYVEIIESLYYLTNGKKFIFSWDNMDIKSYIIEDKNKLEKNIGIWETHRDVFYETYGECGMESDIHWSYRMNNLFSDYVYEKFMK